jgi:hypothetical protein
VADKRMLKLIRAFLAELSQLGTPDPVKWLGISRGD